jgi:malate dehydrogenase (oxaloacetate-decarboxylating)
MDLFIGLSGPGIIKASSLAGMNSDAIVFAMANPTPEVMPEEAKRDGIARLNEETGTFAPVEVQAT